MHDAADTAGIHWRGGEGRTERREQKQKDPSQEKREGVLMGVLLIEQLPSQKRRRISVKEGRADSVSGAETRAAFMPATIFPSYQYDLHSVIFLGP